MAGYTAFMTYILSGTTGSTVYGYSDAIHCNYINSIEFDNLTNKEFNIYFEDIEYFKFLTYHTGVTNGTGFTAHKLYVLAQLLDHDKYPNPATRKPKSNEWKKFDVTDQLIENPEYSFGDPISPSAITSNVFRVPLNKYELADPYDLSYLDYPSKTSPTPPDLPKLSFGDETYFMGNVTSSVEAIAYTTDLAINLPLDQFNSTTNPTWDKESEVYITEIGIYDTNKNLVGIAKLNDPIPKDSTISRTIVFALDF